MNLKVFHGSGKGGLPEKAVDPASFTPTGAKLRAEKSQTMN